MVYFQLLDTEEGDMVISLHQFAKINGKTFSPYCLKVEVYLKLVNIPYQTIETLPNKGPLKKLPFIEDKGRKIPDSRLILEYLKDIYGNELDQNLTEQQLAQGHLLCRLCEESLINVLLFSRWIDNKQWRQFKKIAFGHLPPVIRSLVPLLLRKKMNRKLVCQGYILHDQEQVYAFGADDLEAIAAYLSITPFAVSNEPTSFDATLYAFLSNILDKTIVTPLTMALLKHESLVSYCDRMENVICSTDLP